MDIKGREDVDFTCSYYFFSLSKIDDKKRVLPDG